MMAPQELPPAPAGKHIHPCADLCGDYYICSRPDGCDRDWTCPACEQERRDHYVSLMAEQEPTDAQRSA